MANGGPSPLAEWADVDPARYSFDPGVVRAMALPVPGADALAWVDVVGAVLAGRFGPWAYHWYWTPGEGARLGWITERVPAPADVPVFVAGTLLAWRRWLEHLAERFDRVRPLSGPAGVPDDYATWETAIVHVLRSVVAIVVDDNAWQGWSRRVLQWLLTAKGVPVAQAAALVHGALDERYDDWMTPTTSVIDEIAERLARAVFDLAGQTPDIRGDDWPQDLPSWRATNT